MSNQRYSGSANFLNTSFAIASTQVATFLPFYSFASGIVELANFYEKRNKLALLSGLASLSTGGFYSYQKWVIKSASSSSLLFIGLAISNGIETLDALHALLVEAVKQNADRKVMKKTLYTVFIKAFLCCGWAFFAAGNPVIGLAFLVGAIFISSYQGLMSCVPSEEIAQAPHAASSASQTQQPQHGNSRSSSRTMTMHDLPTQEIPGSYYTRGGQVYLRPQQRPAEQRSANNTQSSSNLPGFKAFGGTGHRLGGN